MKKGHVGSGHMSGQHITYKEVIKERKEFEGMKEKAIPNHVSPHFTPHSAHRDFSHCLLFTLAVPKPLQCPLLAFPAGPSPAFPSVHSSLFFSPAGPPPLSSFTLCDGQVLPALTSYEAGPMEDLLAL